MTSQELIKFEVVAGVIVKDGKILMCRSRANKHYYLPGGKLEVGELEEDAIMRECKEEISIDLIPSTIKKIDCFEAEAYGFAEPRIVVMNCYSFDYNGEIKASAEIEDIFWAGLDDMDKLAPAAQLLLRRQLKN